jgi:hypothetical protein
LVLGLEGTENRRKTGSRHLLQRLSADRTIDLEVIQEQWERMGQF